MSVIVQKFGGSSMANPEQIGKAADRVVQARQAGHDVVVVVSAMGSTTEELMALAEGICVDGCGRERDMLVTAGERIAIALICMALQARGCESISFTGSQAGILTSDQHQNARIIEVRPVRVQDELERGKVVVVAGYQGMSYKREITSLGRGGSDTTAIALAAALDAEAVEIYSDVDGVYSADPRQIPEAVPLEELDVDATLALARGGARVLNADAVEYARREGIVLYCRATDPADGKGQTLVRKFPPEDPGRSAVLAVTGQSDGGVLVRCDEARGQQLLAQLAAGGIAPRRWWQGGGEVMAVLNGVAPEFDGLTAMDGLGRTRLGIVTLVGHRLDDEPWLAKVFEELGQQGTRALAVTARDNVIRLYVDPADVDGTVRALHARFIE